MQSQETDVQSSIAVVDQSSSQRSRHSQHWKLIRGSWGANFQALFFPVPTVWGVFIWSAARFIAGAVVGLALHYVSVLGLWIAAGVLVYVATHSFTLWLNKDEQIRAAIALSGLLPLIGLGALLFFIHFW